MSYRLNSGPFGKGGRRSRGWGKTRFSNRQGAGILPGAWHGKMGRMFRSRFFTRPKIPPKPAPKPAVRAGLAGVAVAGLLAAWMTGDATSARHADAAASRSAGQPGAAATAAISTRAHRAAPKPTPTPKPRPSAVPPSAPPVAASAGRLPQTSALPSTHSSAFRNAIADLWLAVTKDNPSFALPAFFPEAAYRQVKAIAYPDADWQYRLWYDFTLDLRAAHGLTGHDAQLIRVSVPSDEAAWVSPGACYNSVGYWHVAGPRVVYRVDGQVRSFGIASLISWRGVWYVVHFGAVQRDADVGIVDQPADGDGIPGPPGGC
jgi:hypothetical protein